MLVSLPVSLQIAITRARMQSMQIVGVDPNPEMASYALQAAREANLSEELLQLLDGSAEQLPVPSSSQDAVVCTLVSGVTACSHTAVGAHAPVTLNVAASML